MSGPTCIYCPAAADRCIRSHRGEDGEVTHVYACRDCADSRGIRPLYVIISEPAPGQR
ncbi:hypothetical protein ACFVU3_00370 [Streptomyces sp. NPDC058052]|uniref:hypothetical protein n=1 Tax=Streptomyces sp. NPDC058052 TaxID=3346316 RepID=UPI0036F05A76